MKIKDIAVAPIPKTANPKQRRIRKQAPRFIASLINDLQILKSVDSLEGMRTEHVKVLSGGVDAATYLINLPGEQVVVKFGSQGVRAEIEAIEAWRKRHVRAPKILYSGVVPKTADSRNPVSYLVQEALVDVDGRIIETCDEYLTREPGAARRVGRAIGHQLAKIHSSVSDRSFGEFKDATGAKSHYRAWNGYVIDSIKRHVDYLVSLGIDKQDIKAVIKRLETHKFIARGRYLHGDFSIRNIAVKKYDPLKVSVFDPNPIIGDPSWDLSFIINNYQYEKNRLEYDDNQRDLYVKYQQLWIGLQQGYNRQINPTSLLSAQLVQAIYQAQYMQAIGDNLGLKARRMALHQYVAELLR